MSILLKTIDERGIATLTLNRPDLHNAFNQELIAALHETFDALGKDASVRMIVLTGNGKSFSAGADLNWMKAAANYTKQENMADAIALSDMLNAIDSCPKPVIALVNGTALGGGVGLISCADIVISVSTAKFALSEVKFGLIPATISPFVVRAMGPRVCRRLFVTAEMFDAPTAERYGLVSMVRDDLDVALEETLSQMLKNGPDAMVAAKKLVKTVSDKEINDDMRMETARNIADRRATDEAKEGLDAFLNKRKASWIKD